MHEDQEVKVNLPQKKERKKEKGLILAGGSGATVKS